MIQTISILPGVTLRYFQDARFKQSHLTIQFLRAMCREEASLNALLPAILLRGCETAPDIRAITLRLDDLYGASVGPLVRRCGDYQTTGLACSFIADRYALEADRILEPMLAFVRELLMQPVLENGVFCSDYVESEKKNLISTIESQMNDKRTYAAACLMRHMCQKDPLGIPRLGDTDSVGRITAESAYRHYRKILEESPVELFYVGAAQPDALVPALKQLFSGMGQNRKPLPPQTPYRPSDPGEHLKTMAVSQGKLAMGFVTPITNQDPRFAAMQVFNCVFGGGMTGKLFANIREKLSLCYDISSSCYSSKGILTVGAGIDCDKQQLVQEQVLAQLEACCREQITDTELAAAKQALISSLRSAHDSPGAIEGYYATGILSGLKLTPDTYIRQVEQVSAHQVAEVAKTLTLHTVFFLKGEQ